MTKLIAFAGKKRVGKDTAGAALTDVGFIKVAFAGPLKLMTAQLLTYAGATLEEVARMIEGDLKEAPTDFLSGRSPRYAMQTLGTEWGRVLMDDSFWINAFRSRVKDLGPIHNIVVTDCRFENEADVVRELGGTVVHITRLNSQQYDPHASEVGIAVKRGDLLIENKYRSPEDFQNMIKYTFAQETE